MKHVFYAINTFAWGKGETEETATTNCRRNTFPPKVNGKAPVFQCKVWRCHPDTELFDMSGLHSPEGCPAVLVAVVVGKTVVKI